ncbi:MAG: UPF0149 family protein [Gammaproteobacteria bacterium]|nr:UPF0149 family protein [Gammaproteobacteria bacterium]
MPISNQSKQPARSLPHTSSGRGTGRSKRYGASADVLTPNIEAFGHRPLSEQDLQNLAQQLRDPKWSRNAPNIYALEGLLTALLVLPLGLRPGEWLPLVWNESGWRIPAALQDEQQLDGFIDSIVGFMRRINCGLLETPAQFVSILDSPEFEQYARKPQSAHADWVNGFGIALSQSENFKVRPDSVTHRTLFAIAMHSNPSAARIYRGHKQPPTLHEAVLALADLRGSYGPLGPSPTPAHEPSRSRR